MSKEIITWIMPLYTTLVGLVIGILIDKVKTMTSNKRTQKDKEYIILKAIKDGMTILLRQGLIEYYRAFRTSGSVPIDQWDEIESLYDSYKALGGNHSGDKMYEEMKHAKTEVDYHGMKL